MQKSLDGLKAKLQEALKKDEIIVWEVNYQKNSGNYNVLNVTLDKVGGIDLDTVEYATKIIDPIVDEYNLIDESYILDVSSKERGSLDE